ncbi:MAG: polysaccharide ABC transporter ATP-binding protein [Candidatus Sulfotelmatobacter sp.]
MADDIVIRAESLGKKYVIGHEAQRERYVALRDVIARGARNAWRMAADMAKGRIVVSGDAVEEFWALKGVSFEVKRGEVLGIIGRNGAGKSTLLKILSRITEPTEGRVTIKGRVASLLEVGTGFHPELTGRENIFLNGAVLGMARAEIKRKFDEIVAFAEVEKFLDTPVKRYSSGMYVRLAFAVAAHLEPEILVVDEVLAVGDAEFQKKCLGKMQDVAGHGRTVLFVSHNMAAIQRLCSEALVLNAGRVFALNKDINRCIREYLTNEREQIRSEWINDSAAFNNDYFIPKRVTVFSMPCAPLTTTAPETSFVLEIVGTVLCNDPALSVAFCLYSQEGQRLFWSSVHDVDGATFKRLPIGEVTFTVQLPRTLLNEGEYDIEIALMLHNKCYLIAPGKGPRVKFRSELRYSSPFWDREREGPIAPLLDWRVQVSEGEVACLREL